MSLKSIVMKCCPGFLYSGAYDGATALRFLKWGGDKIKHIYSFEFDPVNAVRCEEIIKPYRDKITVIRKGTWDTSATFYIKSGGSGSTITTKGSTKVQLAAIDSELAGVPVTFIKMDVERAELKSLMGAKNTIIKNRPRLQFAFITGRMTFTRYPTIYCRLCLIINSISGITELQPLRLSFTHTVSNKNPLPNITRRGKFFRRAKFLPLF